MDKIYEYVRKHILIAIIIFALSFIGIHFILESFNLMFRQFIYYIAFGIFFVGFVIGVIQVLKKLGKRLKIILIVIFIILVFMSIPIIYIVGIFLYQPEHIVVKEGQKMVAYVNGFITTKVNYYDYKNVFLISKNARIEENYGKGGFDPLEKKNIHEVKSVTYYNNKGEEVADFDGTPFMDLSYVKPYASDRTSSDNAIEFLEKLMKKYGNNISKMELYSDNGFIIYFSNNPKEIAEDNELKRIDYVINQYIEDIKKIENVNNNSTYKIRVDVDGTIFIAPTANQITEVKNKIAMDITEDFIKNPRAFEGKIYYKELDAIHFSVDDNKYYILKNDSRIKFVDSKTNDNCNFEDIAYEDCFYTTSEGIVYINKK